MAQRIRCPHCKRSLVAQSWTAGELRLCPLCQRAIKIPAIPAETEPEVFSEITIVDDVAEECVHCGHELAPGCPYCRRCFHDRKTGRPLSFATQLRLGARRAWKRVAAASLATAGVFLAAFAGVWAWEWYSAARRADDPGLAAIQQRAIEQNAVEPAAAAERLLHAADRDDRDGAVSDLRRIGATAIRFIAAALEASAAEQSPTPAARGNQLAAIDLLGELCRHGAPPDVVAALKTCSATPAIADRAHQVRGLLGDGSALPALRKNWTRDMRRHLFLRRLLEQTARTHSSGLERELRRTRDSLDRNTAALRRLAADEEIAALEKLAAGYWSSLAWLGQQGGEAYAAELFSVARPSTAAREQGGFDFGAAEQEAIREARRRLERVTQRGEPLAASAAGMTLLQCAPQYTLVRHRIMLRLADSLAGASAPAQQVLSWTIAQLAGRSFDGSRLRNLPIDVDRDDVIAAAGWVASESLATPRFHAVSAYPVRPKLEYRVFSAILQHEAALLSQLREGSLAPEEFVARWLDAGIGLTPRIRQMLSPAQRNPQPAWVAAAIVIAVDARDPGVRREIELWRSATDQPQWFRALAYTALGSLDAMLGSWTSGWPNDLELADSDVVISGSTARLFGRLLSSGGDPMQQRLRQASGINQTVKLALQRAAARAEPPPVQGRSR